MKIRTKLMILLSISSLVTSLCIIFVYTTLISEQIIKDSLNDLNAIATNEKRRINSSINHSYMILSINAARPNMILHLEKYNENRDPSDQENLHTVLDSIANSDPYIRRISLLNQDGINVASSDRSYVGKDISQTNFFIVAKNGDRYYELSKFEDNTLGVRLAAPVYHNNNFVGVITMVLNSDEITDFNYDVLGKSGDIYLIKKETKDTIVFLTPTRFDSDAAFNKNIKIGLNPATKAVSAIEATFSDLVDHRGVAVFSATKYIERTNWGLVVKIDIDEALAPVNEIRNFTIVLGGGLIIALLTAAYYFSRRISNPISSLQKVAKQISLGQDIKADVKSNDEIGELAKSFNNMLDDIKIAKELQIETEKLKMAEKEKIQQELEIELNTVLNLKKALDESSLVAITDKNGTITYVNKKFCDVSEYTEEELIGQNHRILKSGYHPPEFYENLWKTISSGHAWHDEIKNVSKSGKYYWVETMIVPLLDSDGKPEQYVAIRTEITDRKNAEELAKIDKEKDEFAAMVSHELKTPLIPISGYAELFLDGSLGNITEMQREKMQVMYENSIRLTTLIQDILDVRKVELKKLNLDIRTESIKEITKRCIDVFQPIAEPKGIKLIDETQDITIACDPDRILQVLNNIVSNSIKFVPAQDGTILINSRNDKDTVMMSIKDNGVGIPKSKQEDLFKKFYQVDKSLTRKSGGTGLGLAISRGIVEAHGGKIWVESEDNQGTTIHFTMQKGNGK